MSTATRPIPARAKPANGDAAAPNVTKPGTALPATHATHIADQCALDARSADAPYRCAACEAPVASGLPILRRGDACPFDLYRCNACGMVQQQPRYTADELSQLYAGDYYVFDEDDAHRWARAVQQYVVHLATLEGRPSRRLLDVGCALGHFAALARARGWQVVGLDVSPEAANRAASRFGLEVRAGTLEHHAASLPQFDVVFLGDVIEHVPHPLHFLRDVRRVLAPGSQHRAATDSLNRAATVRERVPSPTPPCAGGIVCIDTPNWGGFWRRWSGRRWLGLNRFHINLFDAASLTRLLTAAGFAQITAGSYTNYRYKRWASRPEVAALIARLPRALAWRLNRAMARRAQPARTLKRCVGDAPCDNDNDGTDSPPSSCGLAESASLIADPPTDRSTALHRIDELISESRIPGGRVIGPARFRRRAGHRGDNLIVRAART